MIQVERKFEVEEQEEEQAGEDQALTGIDRQDSNSSVEFAAVCRSCVSFPVCVLNFF